MGVHLRAKKRPGGTLKGYYGEFYDAARSPGRSGSPSARGTANAESSWTLRHKLRTGV